MPISTPVMIGVACLFLVIIVVIIAVTSGGDETVPEEIIVEDDNGVTCSTFDGCPDGMEIIPDANGESESECCQKKTCESNGVQCKTTACSSPEGCWDQLTDVRGDSEEECCVKALCSDDICEPGFKLKEGNLSGRSNSDCCEPKPLCSSEVECPEDHIPKAGEPRGDSKEDCCLMKKCGENGWDETKCLESDKAMGDSNERGNTADLCCVTRSCHDNGYDADSTKCPDGLTGVDDDNIIGDNEEDCCVAGKCQDNGWDAAKCSLMSSLSKPHQKINEPRGDSVGECCQEKLCSDYYFDGDSCSEREGGPDDAGTWTGAAQVCFTVDNQYPGQEREDVMSRKLKTNCSFTSQGSGPTKLVSGAVRIPGSGSTQETQKSTCCIPKTCGELNSDNSIQCDDGKTFVPGKTVDTDTESSSLAEQCCSTSKCPDDYKSDQDCESAFDESGEFYELNNGVDNWAELDSTKENCCKPKKCIDIFSDAKCAADNVARPKFNQISANEEIIVDAEVIAQNPEYVGKEGGNCCTAPKCTETEHVCPSHMVLKGTQPAEEATDTNCCKPKLCSDVGWTDEKCRSKTYTRASVRGKLKTDGTVSGPSQEPTLEPGTDYVGDENCCEKDPSSYARMCVGNDWSGGQVVSKSIGASIHDHQGVALSTTNATPSACKELCDANSSCSTFISTSGGGRPTLDAAMGTENNPKCELYRKIGDEVNVPDIIGGEHMHKWLRVQYVKEGNFPEKHRYSGGTGPAVNLLGGESVDWWKTAASTATVRNLSERSNATKIASIDKDDAIKGRDILVAGIDKEFCPLDHLKIYGNHADIFGRRMGTWHPPGGAMQVISANEKRGTSGPTCANARVDHILDNCYRNKFCGAEWIGQAGGANHDRSIVQDDWVSSQIGTLKFGPAMAATRRHCSKGVYGAKQKANGQNPTHKPLGGAYMTPTRKIINGNKVQYGVVNDKPTWKASVGYDKWDGLLLPDDTHLPD